MVIEGDITSEDRTTYEYYPNGSRKSVTYPNGITEEYTYYPDNTLWTLTNKYPDGTVMDVYTYTYDGTNNQTSKHEIINGVEKGTTRYEYDALDRLKKVTDPEEKTTSYTYDRAGNRETGTITDNGQTIVNAYEYNEQNRLLTITTKTDGALTEVIVFTYDNNGNQLKTEVTEYIDGVAQEPVITVTHTYDRRNQLIETETAGGSILTNVYNGEGLRISKTTNGQTTCFLYEYDKVVLEVYADGTEKARNLYGTNLLMRTVDNESYYYIYNGHADVTALIDKGGNITAAYYYDAFGNILEQTGNVDNNITYAGYQYDTETGLYYLNARMYDPKIARFLQEDTYRGELDDPLSLNLYTYCSNNPVKYWDPTGHWQQGDENLSGAAQNLLVELTNAYYKVSDPKSRERIHAIANLRRKDSYSKVSNPVHYEDNKKFYESVSSVLGEKKYFSPDDWSSIEKVYNVSTAVVGVSDDDIIEANDLISTIGHSALSMRTMQGQIESQSLLTLMDTKIYDFGIAEAYSSMANIQAYLLTENAAVQSNDYLSQVLCNTLVSGIPAEYGYADYLRNVLGSNEYFSRVWQRKKLKGKRIYINIIRFHSGS